MEIKVDLHTHTLANPHAYSTLMENVDYALLKGLEAIAMTDHGPFIKDSPHFWHFTNCRDIPHNIKGMIVLRGVECSYTDMNATLDLEDWVLDRQDVIIASMHQMVIEPKDFLKMMVNATKQPYIDIMGHIARTSFTLDDAGYEKIVKKAKAAHKLIELNNHCLEKAQVHITNSKKLMLACKKHQVPIVVNTDSHFCTKIGNVDLALALLSEIDFPEELVMNTSLEKFLGYMSEKKKIVL